MNSLFQKANFTSFVKEIWLLASFLLIHSIIPVKNNIALPVVPFVPSTQPYSIRKAFVLQLYVSPFGGSFKALQDRLQRKQTTSNFIFLLFVLKSWVFSWLVKHCDTKLQTKQIFIKVSLSSRQE